MNAPAFTPGPWEVAEATEHHGYYVTSNVGNTVCDLYTMSQPSLPSTANGGPSKPVPFMHEMDGPNARLIAAAPELLEALEDAIEFMDSVDPSSFTLRDAREVVAKARGDA